MSIWYTHEQTPHDLFSVALIAVPLEDVDDTEPMLLSQLYEWDGMEWRGRSDNEPLEYAVYWFAYEEDVLNGLRNMLRRASE